MKWLKRGLGLALLLGLVVAGWRFVDDHQTPVDINYDVGEFLQVPLWKALLGAALSGGVLVGMPLAFVLMRARLEGRHYRKSVRRLEKEVHELRNLPLVRGEDSAGRGSD